MKKNSNVIEGEVISSSLSFNQYVNEIKNARNQIQEGVLRYATYIKDCLNQYPDRQLDLASEIEISPSMLSKWKSVGNNEQLLQLEGQTPNTFRVLYDLTRLKNEYKRFYGDKRGTTEYNKLLGSGKITIETESKDVAVLFSQLKKKVDAKKEQTKEDIILGLTIIKKTGDEWDGHPTVQDLVDRGEKFKTIVIKPSPEQMRRWGKLELSGYIAEEFNVAELRYPTPVDVGLCLIAIEMKNLKTGLKLLDACGFEYRDIFVPQQSVPMLTRMSEETVILRGERDKGTTPNVAFADTTTQSLLDIAEKIGKKPYLCILGEGVGWRDVIPNTHWQFCEE
jgi:hypothetical protein